MKNEPWIITEFPTIPMMPTTARRIPWIQKRHWPERKSLERLEQTEGSSDDDDEEEEAESAAELELMLRKVWFRRMSPKETVVAGVRESSRAMMSSSIKSKIEKISKKRSDQAWPF